MTNYDERILAERIARLKRDRDALLAASKALIATADRAAGVFAGGGDPAQTVAVSDQVTAALRDLKDAIAQAEAA